MRHYEVVFLIHPDQSEQVAAMVERYRKIITHQGGRIHRYENWGRRQLAYVIDGVNKAHYILFNIECGQGEIEALQNAFRFNDAIIRYLLIKMSQAVTKPSMMVKHTKDETDDKGQGN